MLEVSGAGCKLKLVRQNSHFKNAPHRRDGSVVPTIMRIHMRNIESLYPDFRFLC